ncbi:MAG: Protoporphyrinogen oxidase [Myxococcota bacterium]|nr:Protoporphyrinogen oxidase [Myxococcota bacterium]
MPRVAIIGAGLAGLSTAVFLDHLSRARQRPVDLTVFEESNRPGGRIRTFTRDGYAWELGPESMLAGRESLNVLLSLAGIPDLVEYARPEAKRRWILRDGALRQLPSSPAELASTQALSKRGLLRAAAGLAAAPLKAREDISVDAWFRRVLGPEATDMLIQPFVSGIHAGDSERLSFAASFPRLAPLTEGRLALLRRMARKKQGEESGVNAIPYPPATKIKRGMISFRGGLETLPRSLAEALEGCIRYSTRITWVRKNDAGKFILATLSGEELEYDVVIMALPANAAAEMMAELLPRSLDKLAGINFIPVATAHLAYTRQQVEHPLDGFGFLNPPREKRPFLGALFSSELFAGRAPRGNVSIRVFLGGANDPGRVDLLDDKIIELAHGELRGLLGVRGEPAATHVHRWREALPAYELGHLDRVGAVEEEAARHWGLYFTGFSYRGIGMPDVIDDAWRTACRTAALLKW